MHKYSRYRPHLPSGELLGTAIVVSTFVGYGAGVHDNSALFGILTGCLTFFLIWCIDAIWKDGTPQRDKTLFVDDVLSQFAKHAAPSSQPERESTR